MQCCREFLMCKKFESANSDLNGRRSEKREGLAKPCVTCAKLSHLHIEDIKSAHHKTRKHEDGDLTSKQLQFFNQNFTVFPQS